MANYPAVNAERKNLVGFRQTVLGDYIRPWMFQLVIPNVMSDSRSLTALSRGVEFPTYKVKAESIPYQGLTLKVASVAEFTGTLPLTILGSHTHELFQKFMEWSAAAYEPGHMYSAAPDSYKVDDVKLHQLDRAGKTVMTWCLFGTWCGDVKPWKTSQQDTKPGEFNVTLNYDFFTYSSKSSESAVKTDTTGTGIESDQISSATDRVVIKSGNNLSGDQQG